MSSYQTPLKSAPPLRTVSPGSPALIQPEFAEGGYRITLEDLNILMVNGAANAPNHGKTYRTYFACPQEYWQRFKDYKVNKEFTDHFHDVNKQLEKNNLWLKLREYSAERKVWQLTHVTDMNAEGIHFDEVSEEKAICKRLAEVFGTPCTDNIEDFGLQRIVSLPVKRIVEFKQQDLSLHIDSVVFKEDQHYVVGAMSIKHGGHGRIPQELADIVVYCPVRSKITEYLYTYTAEYAKSKLDRSPFFFSQSDLNFFQQPMTVAEDSPLQSFMRNSDLFEIKLQRFELKSRNQMTGTEIKSKLDKADIKYNQEQVDFLATHDDAIVFFSNRTTVLKMWFGLRAVEKTLCDLAGIAKLMKYRQMELHCAIPIGVVTTSTNPLLATIYLGEDKSFLLHEDEDGVIHKFGATEPIFLRMLDNYVPVAPDCSM